MLTTKSKHLTPLFATLLLLISFFSYGQTYTPGSHVVVNDAVAPAQATPLEARSMFYDGTNFLYRAYNGTAEVLTYLNTTASRTGQFIIVVDSGGALQGNGTYIGGYNTFYMFKDSTTSLGLVKMNLFGTGIGNCPSCLLAANNLSDLGSLATALVNLGLNNVNNTSDATKNAASVTLTNHTISGSVNTLTNIANSSLVHSTIGLSLINTGATPQVTTTPAALGTSLVLDVPWANGSDSGFLRGTDWTFFDNKNDSTTISNDSLYNWVNGIRTLQSVIAGSGGVGSVNPADASLLFSPTTGPVLGRVNPAWNANWTGQHTFLSFAPIFSTLATAGGLYYGDGFGQLLQSSAGTTAQILESQGGTAPVFFTPNVTTVSGWLGFTPLSTALGSTQIYVGNALNTAAAVNVSGDATLSNAGLLTNIGLKGVALPSLAAGNLKYTGSAWTFDNSGIDGTLASTQIAYGTSANTIGGSTNMTYLTADSSANFKKVKIVGTTSDSCSLCMTVSNPTGPFSSSLPGIHIYPSNSTVNPAIFLHDSRTGLDTGLQLANFNSTFSGGVSIIRSNEPGGLVIQTASCPMFFETNGYDGADFAGAIQPVTKHWSIDDAAGGERGRSLYVYGTVQLEDSILIGSGSGGTVVISTANSHQLAYTSGTNMKLQVQNHTNQTGYSALAIDSNANIYFPGGPYAVSGGVLYTGPSSGSSKVMQTVSSTSSQVLIGGTTPAFGAVDLTSMVTNALPVANGGTGNSSLTAYAVLAGGTTSTGALQQVSGLGTSGFVLTSNGPGALPTWQAGSGGGGGSGSPGGANQDLQAKSGSNFYGCGGCAILDTVYHGVRLNSGARAAFLQASTDSTGLWLQNTTAAATGAQQFSQVLTLEGQGWKTTATAASQSVKFHEVVEPVQGTTNPTGLLVWGSNVNNAAAYMSDSLTLSSAGVVTLESGGPTYNAANTGSGTSAFDFTLSSTGAVQGGLSISGSSGEERLNAISGYFLTLYAGGSERARIIGPDVLIGTTTDNAAAILNVSSTTKGTIPAPSMTTTQQNAISSPPEGLNVYDNVLHTPAFYNGTSWVDVVNLTGKNDLTGQTGAVTVTSYAVPGSTTFNTFRVGGYVTVTAVSLDVIQLQVTWTDETSTSRTQSFFVQGATTGIGATGAFAYSPIDIRVLKGTTITVATILTTGTGSITYDAGANITLLY